MLAMDDEHTSTMKQAIADLQPKILDTPPSATQPRVCTIQPAAPLEFDGDCNKGLAFLNLCQTYIQLCPKEFLDEQTKIVWAMSYMKAG